MRTRKYITGRNDGISEYRMGGYIYEGIHEIIFHKLSLKNRRRRRRSQRIPYRTLNGFMIWHYGCLLYSYLKYWSQRKFNAIQLVSVSCRLRLSRSKHDTLWILLIIHWIRRDYKNSGSVSKKIARYIWAVSLLEKNSWWACDMDPSYLFISMQLK